MNGDEKVSKNISARGGKRPGAGRPPGAPNKLTRDLKEAAALHTDGCLEVLVHLRDHAESEQVRLAAATALLDRGHGRPRQELELSKREGITVHINRQPVLNVRPLPVKSEGHNEP